jgi:hypothetical protein
MWVHVKSARQAAVEEGARGVAPRTDVVVVGDIVLGLEEHEHVRWVGWGVVCLQVAGARLMDGNVTAGQAAVGGAGQVLAAHVTTKGSSRCGAAS